MEIYQSEIAPLTSKHCEFLFLSRMRFWLNLGIYQYLLPRECCAISLKFEITMI